MSSTGWSLVAALGLGFTSPHLVGCAMDIDEVGEEERAGSWLEGKGGGGGSVGPKEPVIFVHGCPPPFATHEQVSHFFDPMRGFLAGQGYTDQDMYTFVFDAPQCASNIDMAAQIADFARDVRLSTGHQKVDIVAHSMGALATRLYLYQGGRRCVRDFASIGGAHHGGEGAADGVFLQSIFGYPAYEGMKEMYPPYACEGQTSGGAADIQALLNGCLTPTGRTAWADETPNGSVRYLSIRNTLDEIVVPVGSACLNQEFQNDCSDDINTAVTVPPGPGPCGPGGCPAHVTMLFDPGVMAEVYGFLEQEDDFGPSSMEPGWEDDVCQE